MKESSEINSLSFLQRTFLILCSFILVSIVFLFRGGFDSKSQLNQLARNSLDPNQAIANGRPTLIEFYADWCEVCNKMAPNMIQLEKKYHNDIDIVLVNVDNTIWNSLIDKYNVNGIPQFDFFNKKGEFQAKLIGLQEKEEIEKSFELLFKDQLLNQSYQSEILDKNIKTTKFNTSQKYISPRSHG